MCSYVEFCKLVKNHMVILSVFKFQDFGFFLSKKNFDMLKNITMNKNIHLNVNVFGLSLEHEFNESNFLCLTIRIDAAAMGFRC